MQKHDNKMTLTISTGSVLRVVLVLLLCYVLFFLRDLILVLLTAVVVASAIEPATRLLGKYKIPRIPAVVLVYVVVILSLVGIFYAVVPPLLRDVISFLQQTPQYLDAVNVADLADRIDVSDSQRLFETIRSLTAGDLFANLKNYIVTVPGEIFGTVGTVFGSVLSFTLIIVFSFYFAATEKGIDNFLKVVTPVRHQAYIIDLWHRSRKKIGLWMQGQLLLMLIIGVLVYLGLSIMQVEHAFLFAVLAALFELIPIFGPVLASVPVILVSFVQGGVPLALAITGLYVIIQQFENHLIYPLVVNKVVGVPALLVIISLIIGAQLAGFLGIILSVPLAAALMELTNDIQKRNSMLLKKEHDTDIKV